MREDGNQKEWLRQFKQLDEPETFNDKMKQFFKDMGVTIVSLTYFVGFRNRLPGSHSMIFLIAFLVFVVLDVIFSLQLIITKQKDSGTADIISQYVFIFVYPLTSVISPIIGIIAVSFNFYLTFIDAFVQIQFVYDICSFQPCEFIHQYSLIDHSINYIGRLFFKHPVWIPNCHVVVCYKTTSCTTFTIVSELL